MNNEDASVKRKRMIDPTPNDLILVGKEIQKRGRQKLRWVEIKRERPRERDECDTAIVVIVVVIIICRYLYYLLKYYYSVVAAVVVNCY